MLSLTYTQRFNSYYMNHILSNVWMHVSAWSILDSAYVKICIDGVTTQTTKMKKNGSHLTWNQDFTFHLRRLKHADVRRNFNRPMVKLELFRARFELVIDFKVLFPNVTWKFWPNTVNVYWQYASLFRSLIGCVHNRNPCKVRSE